MKKDETGRVSACPSAAQNRQNDRSVPDEIPAYPMESEPGSAHLAEHGKNDCFADGAVTVGHGTQRIHCMTIIGQIEGHYLLGGGQKSTGYEHLIPSLVCCDEDDEIAGLLIILNTVGGDVEAGLAIAELIASMKKPTCSLILGGGHSIGVPLAVSARRSFIVPSATMTLHPVRMNGLVIGAPQTYAYFSRMQERIVSFIAAHSRCGSDTLNRLIMNTDAIATDMGTIIDGSEAVRYGIIDEIGGLKEATAFLRAQTETEPGTK